MLNAYESGDENNQEAIEIDDERKSYIVINKQDTSKRNRKKYENLEKQMVEKDENGQYVGLWTIDAIVAPSTDHTKLYYRYYDATKSRPDDEDDFEYTLVSEIPGKWFSFHLPEDLQIKQIVGIYNSTQQVLFFPLRCLSSSDCFLLGWDTF